VLITALGSWNKQSPTAMAKHDYYHRHRHHHQRHEQSRYALHTILAGDFVHVFTQRPKRENIPAVNIPPPPTRIGTNQQKKSANF
jgi:hypothetical protein